MNRTYTATGTANVISTAGDAALSVADPSTTAPGRLVNGAFSLASPLLVGGNPLPAVVKTWTGPASNDPVQIAFSQSIGANEALRTGTYSKTLTFTLSTTNPCVTAPGLRGLCADALRSPRMPSNGIMGRG